MVEERLCYREHLDDLLREVEGRHVLIVGREVVADFDDLDAAGARAARDFSGRPVFIKKVSAVEPIQTLGGASADPTVITDAEGPAVG